MRGRYPCLYSTHSFSGPRADRVRISLVIPLALIVAVGCGAPLPTSNSGPHVIIFDIDTLRADHLGCYGYERSTSPSIDSFAKEAVQFKWAFAQAPNTPPSQASILTGMYPTSHGRIGNEQKIPDRVDTLAEVLRANGFTTAAFVDGGLMVRGFGMEQGFDVYDDAGGHLKKIGPRVRDWIDQHLEDPVTRDAPFFLLVHTYDVHSPYELTPEPFRSTFVTEISPPPGVFRNDMSKFMADVWNRRAGPVPPMLNENELQWAIAMYDGGIRHVDAWFGEFERFLEKRGLFGNSYVVVISDHGDEFQEHGNLFHDKIYTTVTQVPLLIRFPGSAFRTSCDQVVETIDLAPTLLEALGIEAPAGMQGRSLMAAAKGQRLDRERAFSESPYYGRRIAFADRDTRLFLTARTGAVELYRYREDPLEQRDLSDNDEPTVNRMRNIVELWEKTVNESASLPEEGKGFSETAKEQLKALGYIQ